MRRIKYTEGERLHENSRLIFLEDSEPNVSPQGIKHRTAYFKCECGERKRIAIDPVRRGLVISCGCYQKAMVGKMFSTHGRTRNELYPTWLDMIARTSNQRHMSYSNYGGRGIRVCSRWSCEDVGFENFVEDMGERPKGYSLDRIDTNGDYSPDNCRWADSSMQGFNKRPVSSRSGVTGVYHDIKTETWISYIGYRGTRINLGSFQDKESAVKVRKEAEKHYYGFELNY